MSQAMATGLIVRNFYSGNRVSCLLAKRAVASVRAPAECVNKAETPPDKSLYLSSFLNIPYVEYYDEGRPLFQINNKFSELCHLVVPFVDIHKYDRDWFQETSQWALVAARNQSEMMAVLLVKEINQMKNPQMWMLSLQPRLNKALFISPRGIIAKYLDAVKEKRLLFYQETLPSWVKAKNDFYTTTENRLVQLKADYDRRVVQTRAAYEEKMLELRGRFETALNESKTNFAEKLNMTKAKYEEERLKIITKFTEEACKIIQLYKRETLKLRENYENREVILAQLIEKYKSTPLGQSVTTNYENLLSKPREVEKLLIERRNQLNSSIVHYQSMINDRRMELLKKRDDFLLRASNKLMSIDFNQYVGTVGIDSVTAPRLIGSSRYLFDSATKDESPKGSNKNPSTPKGQLPKALSEVSGALQKGDFEAIKAQVPAWQKRTAVALQKIQAWINKTILRQ